MILTSPTKALRARIIREHLHAAGRPPDVVCFTCGNAADALRAEGLHVIEVGPRGPLTPTEWWTPEQIARAFPYRFDATSGHLPLPLMARLAEALLRHHGHLEGRYLVPTGSGETLVALRLAYPLATFVPLHSDHPAISLADASMSPLLRLPQPQGAVYRPEYDPEELA